jgi:hypothetical protein
MRPLEPRFDALFWAMLGVHASVVPIHDLWPDCLARTEACIGAVFMRQTSIAGGLGGGAPAQRGARRAEPAPHPGAQRSTSAAGARIVHHLTFIARIIPPPM